MDGHHYSYLNLPLLLSPLITIFYSLLWLVCPLQASFFSASPSSMLRVHPNTEGDLSRWHWQSVPGRDRWELVSSSGQRRPVEMLHVNPAAMWIGSGCKTWAALRCLLLDLLAVVAWSCCCCCCLFSLLWLLDRGVVGVVGVVAAVLVVVSVCCAFAIVVDVDRWPVCFCCWSCIGFGKEFLKPPTSSSH